MLPTLLIVDDEQSTRQGLLEAYADRFDCYGAENLDQAKLILNSEKVDVLLTDVRLGAENGLDLLNIRNEFSDFPVTVVMTAYGSVEVAVEAVKRGAFHFIKKPLDLDELELLLIRALKSRQTEEEKQSLIAENQLLKKTKDPEGESALNLIIGNSEKISQIKKTIKQVAKTKANILIEGESGTGKELAAKALYALSKNPSSPPLVTVNCAALPSQILESELFGHEKGAFTDAKTKRIGRFEEASGGTIFLDEIGEIDPATQVRLLRVLSEKVIQRIGSNKDIEIDVRVITATNKSLMKLVEEGSFREDLYFRLNVVKMEMPPLRERREDIIPIADKVLKDLANKNDLSLKPVSKESYRLLESYDWPGNVRQLSGQLERALILSESEWIQPSDFSLENVSKSAQTLSEGEDEQRFLLSEVEKFTINRALNFTKGNKSEAAKLLGISRRTLHRKLEEFSKNI